MPRVSRSAGPVRANAAPGIGGRRQHVEREHAFRERRVLAPQVGRRVSSHSLPACCTQNPADEIVNSRAATAAPMRDREERNAVEVDLVDPGVRVEHQVEDEMAAFVSPKPHRATGKKHTDGLEAILGSAGPSPARTAEPTAQRRVTRLINRRGIATYRARMAEPWHNGCCLTAMEEGD